MVAFIVTAQISLINDDIKQEWTEVRYSVMPQGRICDDVTTISYGEKVTKNDIIYTSVKSSSDSEEQSLLGYMRQDGEKYYFNPIGIEEEFLLYDFSLQKGEQVEIIEESVWKNSLYISLKKDVGDDIFYHSVSDVSIYMDKSGLERKQITLDNGEIWIEGIGSTKGLLHSCSSITGSGTTLLSYSENNTQLYDVVCPCEKNNFSFVDDDMKWAYLYSETEEISSIKVPTILTVRYEYKGDTIINGFIYKKMFKSLNNGRIWLELGYFRQDKSEVFFIKKGEIEEGLAYDFSSDLRNRLDWDDNLLVESDTIVIYNARKKISRVCDDRESSSDNWFYCYDIVIEDVGSLFAPAFDTLYYCPAVGVGCPYMTKLLCVQKGDEIIWHDPDYNDCYYEQTAINTIENQQISISPNPVKDILYLTLPTANNLIQIIDTQGRKVLQTECGETASVNVSLLKNGVYTVIVNNNQSQTFVKNSYSIQ
ncbi:MAG: T9SS type A sorting domain-containing protein [Bacteroidales bacterium]|nr:T9SS type A sorting domain-containing protein [Bacteroidales bacterium]